MGEVVYLFGNPWVDKKTLAKELGVSVSFVEKRMRDGLPSRLMAGRRQFQIRAAEDWLRTAGYLVEDHSA